MHLITIKAKAQLASGASLLLFDLSLHLPTYSLYVSREGSVDFVFA